MQTSAAAATSPKNRGFAALLADLAAPEKKSPPARDLDGLADDIVSLTYENALRAQARYRPSANPPLPLPVEPEDNRQLEVRPGALAPTPDESRQSRPPASPPAAQCTAGRKHASVTVRLTHQEDTQLRQRAAEAGLTVSAYLRSCAFEVETLRSQVKQTLAELRHGGPQPVQLSLWSRICPWKTRAAAGNS